MIISKSFVQRLTPMLKEASPQASDGVVVVPSLFSFVGLPPEPTFRQVVPGAGVTQPSSFATQSNAQVANAAQSIVTICRLGPGYWRLRIQGSYRSNYVLATAQPGDFRILLADAVSNWQIVTKFAQLAGSQDIFFQEEFSIQNNLDITAILDTNGAAQEHVYSLSVWANHLL